MALVGMSLHVFSCPPLPKYRGRMLKELDELVHRNNQNELTTTFGLSYGKGVFDQEKRVLFP